MINVIASICVDENKNDKTTVYPGAMGLNADERRIFYWKLVTVMAASVKKINPDFVVSIYTNDTKDVIANKVNIRQLLNDIGVQVIYLPFKKYKYPQHWGKMFRNAFHKLELISEIGSKSDNDQYILLDTDCIWLEKNEQFISRIKSGKILVYDIYQRTPDDPGHINLSRLSIGKTYRLLMPDYPTPAPIHYGGEFISGTPEDYNLIDKLNHEIYNKCLEFADDNGHPPKFDNGQSLFDNDEYISSYAFGKLHDKVELVNPFLQRIVTLPDYTNVTPATIDKAIWHLMVEKRTGLQLIYELVIDRNSKFWACEPQNLKKLIGEYVGIPERKYFYKDSRSVTQKIKSYIYKAASFAGIVKK